MSSHKHESKAALGDSSMCLCDTFETHGSGMRRLLSNPFDTDLWPCIYVVYVNRYHDLGFEQGVSTCLHNGNADLNFGLNPSSLWLNIDFVIITLWSVWIMWCSCTWCNSLHWRHTQFLNTFLSLQIMVDFRVRDKKGKI